MLNNTNQMFPHISVIIPTYNHGKFICDAIESVLMQGYPNKEIIVVDDGSTDNTRNVVAKYINAGLKFIYKSNGGLASARNAGILNATGYLIAFLDADDVWLEDKLSMQYNQMLSKGSALVGCGYYWVDIGLNVTATTLAINFKDRKTLLSKLLLNNVIYGSGSGVLLKRECFTKVGLFDEKLTGSEDWDMWLRIAQYYDISFVEKPLAKIRLLNNSMSSVSNADRMLHNELAVLNKYFCSNRRSLAVFLRAKSFSYRYFKAAIAYKEAGKRKESAKCCLKFFFLFPFCFLSKSHLCLLLWILLGENFFQKLGEINKVKTLKLRTK